jgi:hypothetical protein
MKIILIVSGNQKEAEQLARTHHMTKREWRYVSDPHQVMGMRGQVAWFTGSYMKKERDLLGDIIEVMRSQEIDMFYINDLDFLTKG